ncbi:MAG: tRNA (adenosine(37)-N6)-threonylcarbamoyltransferase complex transferase subunit TsaD [Opitutales bacterium]
MILGIESSCDESALALFDPANGLVDERVFSQTDLHAHYGGVVPDLASREHVAAFTELVGALADDINFSAVREIAVTVGPGLAGCLAVGMALAKALGLALSVPVRAVNHLRGHAFSPFISVHAKDPGGFAERLRDGLPHLGLIVSGGNSILFELRHGGRIEVLAQTADDAAGEALDKGAKLLGLPYPGGPQVERLASGGNAAAYEFPGGIADPRDLRFSFSGLKTSLRYRLEKMTDADVEAVLPDLCASYQAAVVRQLLLKTRHALRGKAFRSLGLSGGVANNAELRSGFEALGEGEELPVLIAERRHTGDNAGMIAFAAWSDPTAQAAPVILEPSLPITPNLPSR